MKKTYLQLFVLCGFCMSVCLMVSLPLVSCGNKNTKVFDTGSLDGNTYQNSYFGFRMNIPNGWYILNRAELDRVNRESASAVPNEAMRQEMQQLMELQSIPLLTSYRTAPGSSEDFNPSIQVVAENLKWLPDVKTGEHYLLQAIEIFRASGMPYEDLDVPVTFAIVGDRNFATIKLRIDQDGYKITQEWYSIVQGGFALNFGFTYDSADDQMAKEMEDLRQNILFTQVGK